VSVAVRRFRARRAATAPAVIEAAPVPLVYVGLATRTLAFSIDAAIINVVAIVTAAVSALVLSVISIPKELHTVLVAIGGVAYFLWLVGYFVVFWTTTGQTPGDRLMHIRVVPASGGSMRPRRALLRFLALWLAALPLFAGYLMILVNDRRRGLHDLLARTVVVEWRDPPVDTRPTRTAITRVTPRS
jgi:uncharacterized RDD family membrane protein YckC